MQVTLRHRQAGAGSFFVDCQLQFTEEEKSIIQHRGLGKHVIHLPPGIPHGSGIRRDSMIVHWLKILARFCLMLGIFFFIVNLFFPGCWHYVIFFTAIGGGPLLYFRYAHERHEAAQQDQTISLQQLLLNPVFTVSATDLNKAHEHEAAIRYVLSDMKQFLVGNTAVKEVETFEL